MEINRYDLGRVPYEDDFDMVLEKGGDYVLYSDYVKEKQRWVEENNRLRDRLNDIRELTNLEGI